MYLNNEIAEKGNDSKKSANKFEHTKSLNKSNDWRNMNQQMNKSYNKRLHRNSKVERNSKKINPLLSNELEESLEIKLDSDSSEIMNN